LEIPLTDLKAQLDSIRPEINKAISRVLASGHYILGPEVESFEHEMANYLGTDYAIGVASGTDALHLALLASGIGPEDEVITTPFTFVATVEAISHCGAKPVFADINKDTLNIDVDKIEERITPRTKAILPVHLYGLSADMTRIKEIATRHGLQVIEDCAQSLGGTHNGMKTGTIGDVGCLSFFPSKNLGAFGDGGMVVTNNKEIALKVQSLRKHGSGSNYHYDSIGFNSRLDSIQAAILNVKLKHLDNWIIKRRENAELYDKLLGGIDGIELLDKLSPDSHAMNYYTIRLNNKTKRDSLRAYLGDHGIATNVYYPLSLHLQKAYASLGYKKGDFRVSEAAQATVLSLPMCPELHMVQIKEIENQIRNYLGSV
jgi:UDP-2-acetamido-2-deoxy-ribo-hexuluronate aminotransferase